MRIRLGLKLWSTNVDMIAEARSLAERGLLDYIELFCVPDSLGSVGGAWQSLAAEFVVHAPHSMAGLNFSIAAMKERNKILAEESLRLADIVGAETVIFHPGAGGRLEETIRQASAIRDSRMVFENKPKMGLDGSICVGYLPGELREISDRLNTRICLDFGHAVAAANSLERSPMEFLEEFLGMAPAIYHLTDGDYSSETDRHDPYGGGNFPLQEFLARIPDGARVTDEAKRISRTDLQEFVADHVYIDSLLNGSTAELQSEDGRRD